MPGLRVQLGTSRADLACSLVREARERFSSAEVQLWVCHSDAMIEGPYPTDAKARQLRIRLDEADLANRLGASRESRVFPLWRDEELVGLLVISGQPPDPESLGGFSQLAAAALAGHRDLEALRSREAELRAMLRTARELSAESETQTILDSIVTRARTLLRADTSYIALVEGPRARVRVVVGSGSQLEGLTLDPGRGLGGQVAAKERPYYTPDYLSDARFDHTAEIDQAVRREGLRSILGAPMKASNEFLGVLFVANRRPRRTFNERHVEVLQGLADQASVALRRARVLEEAHAAAERFRHLHQVAAEQNAALRRSAMIRDRLTELVLNDANLPTIVQTLSEFAGCIVQVVDVNDAVVAYADTVTPSSIHLESSQPNPSSLLRVPLIAAGEILGQLVLHHRPTPHIKQVADDAARALALVIVKARAVMETHRRLQGEFFDELLRGRAPIAYLTERGVKLGLNIGSPYRLAVTETRDDDSTDRSTHRSSFFLTDILSRSVVEIPHRSRFVYFIPDADDGGAERIGAEILRRHRQHGWNDCRLALSDCCQGIGDYAIRYREAIRCLRVAAIVGPTNALVTARALGAYYLLLDRAREPQIQEFVVRTLNGIWDDDDPDGGFLVKTTEAFFANGANLTRAARSLFIHPNTLYYRLNRILELTGLNPRDGRDAFHLQLAIALRRTLEVENGDLEPPHGEQVFEFPGGSSGGPRLRSSAGGEPSEV